MKLYERLLTQLAAQLNELHDSKHSVRYWRIILGPWLASFIGIFLDRYRSLRVAVDSGKVTNTWISPEFPKEYLANDFSEFRDNCFEDGYNHCLFSQIIKSSEGIPWEAINNEDTLVSESRVIKPFQKNGIRWAIIRLLGAYSKLIPESLGEMVAIQSYIKPMDLIKLQLSMKMLPCPYRPRVDVVSSEANWDLRKNIKLRKGENHFESILIDSILLHFPKVYLEGYSSMVQKARDAYPKYPKVILTSNAYKMDEGFKFWVADQVSRGVKLATTQHGGHVGDGLWSIDDDHEIDIANRYYSWGWTRENESKTVPMPSSMLGVMKDCISDPKGTILCVPGSSQRYLYQMFSTPHGPLVLESIKFQEKFLKEVSRTVLSLLVFRLDGERGWEEKLRWQNSSIPPKVYQGNMPYRDHLATSRVCVCFYNGTPFLETFAANYPTILCWDPRYTELNKLAQPYFKLLREVGILYDSPESAASKLNEIYQDPNSWWVSPKIQDARNKFCDRFARTSNDWLAQWKRELTKLATQ
ncbi:MAG TPA: hypothetical protein EYO71_07040 [Rhodospirillales bacterium]|nr:hypothetical protein [Rhodospirillales bacterium]